MTEFEEASEALKEYCPAFPQQITGQGQITNNFGMSLRDYFAAKVMQGICANSRWNCTKQQSNVVREAYEMADAMLAARQEKSE